MAAKRIEISADDVTYALLPGGGGELTRDGQVIEDTILGQTYKSGFTGPITWGLNADAIYKGFAGYMAKLLKPGTPTAMAAEATTFVSGKTYRITAATKRIIDRSAALTVFDAAVDHTADVESVDFLFGTVTFKSTYTVGGAVTVTGTYLPMTTLAKFTSYTLNQTAEPIKTSDMPALQANGGWDTFIAGLKSVSLDLPTVFASADAWHTALTTRTEYVIEVNPDGAGLGATGSVARGFFRLMTAPQSGDVGALEEQTLHFELSVPLQATGPSVQFPFSWEHGANSPIPTAIKTCLTAFLNDTLIWGKYLHDGVAGWKGQGTLSNLTLTGGMDTPNVFTFSMQGTGAPSVV